MGAIKKWVKRNFGMHLWKEFKGQLGKKLVRIEVNGDRMHYVYEPIPDRDIFHISVVIFGKCHDVVISERTYNRIANLRLMLHPGRGKYLTNT